MGTQITSIPSVDADTGASISVGVAAPPSSFVAHRVADLSKLNQKQSLPSQPVFSISGARNRHKFTYISSKAIRTSL